MSAYRGKMTELSQQFFSLREKKKKSRGLREVEEDSHTQHSFEIPVSLYASPLEITNSSTYWVASSILKARHLCGLSWDKNKGHYWVLRKNERNLP